MLLSELVDPKVAPLMLIIGCALMTAAAWWCQLLRYPALRSIEKDKFPVAHKWHTFQISLIVIPGMLLQLAGTALLVVDSGVNILYKVVNTALCVASIGPTLSVSGPIHGKLANSHDSALLERLLKTNLPRTIAWTIQLIINLPLVKWLP